MTSISISKICYLLALIVFVLGFFGVGLAAGQMLFLGLIFVVLGMLLPL